IYCADVDRSVLRFFSLGRQRWRRAKQCCGGIADLWSRPDFPVAGAAVTDAGELCQYTVRDQLAGSTLGLPQCHGTVLLRPRPFFLAFWGVWPRTVHRATVLCCSPVWPSSWSRASRLPALTMNLVTCSRLSLCLPG